MAELNVLLICNEKFEPCAITLPYYRPTNTELLRHQIQWTPEWKTAMWRQIVTAKVRNQAANVAHFKRAHSVLDEIAKRCEKGGEVPAQKVSVATLHPHPNGPSFYLTRPMPANPARLGITGNIIYRA